MAKKSIKRIEGRYTRRIRHGDSDVHDLCLYTRRPTKFLFKDLSGLWGGKDDAQERLAIFLMYNKYSFAFLSIDVRMSEDGTPTIIFEPAEKVGCAPLYSPVNGKVCASIIVEGNMNEDVSEVLPLLDGNLDIQFSDKLKLPYKAAIRPPIYFECAKYVDQYYKAKRIHWQKFISEERIEHSPSSSTLWTKYALKSFNPLDSIKYPNKKNLLSENHTEWKELNYVLKMCLDELQAITTPKVSRRAYNEKVEDLRRKIDLRNISKPNELKTKTSDPLEIKKLKEIGNRVINSITSEYRAWNVDFAKLFEGYVQHVFSLLSKQVGAHVYCNNHFSISGSKKAWELSYIEPDIYIMKGDRAVAVDAKYKMHMYNLKSEKISVLKESFRHDLHQLLAYSSFQKKDKVGLLVYPYTSFKCVHRRISANILSTSIDVYLVGIPWGNCTNDDNTSYLPIEQKVQIAVKGLSEIVFK